MDHDRHHAGALCSFGIKRLELILGAAKKLLRLMILKNHYRDIIQLYGVRQRDELSMGSLDFVRLLVVDPVRNVLKSGLGKQIEGFRRFGKTWAEPSRGRFSSKFVDRLNRFANLFALILYLLHRPLDESVAHKLPAGFPRSFSDFRIGAASGAADSQGDFDLVLVEHRLQAPESDAHAIFEPSEVRYVRSDLSSAWRGQDRARHRSLDIPLLDIDNGPHHQSSRLWKTKWWPIYDR